jgi:hypothetical protein
MDAAAILLNALPENATQETSCPIHPKNGWNDRRAMSPRIVRRPYVMLLVGSAALLWSIALFGEPVAVRYPEGSVHGFLVLRTLDGTTLAAGDLTQLVAGDRVTIRLVFHFKDGSLHDEEAVFSQRERIRLLSDHLVQKGPAFSQPIEMAIDGASGRVTVRYVDDHGEQKVVVERLDLPADLANGIVPIVLKNVRPESLPSSVSMVVATPKPRLVKLHFAVAGEDSFSTGDVSHQATHFVVKVEIGGIAGLLAPLVGKQPPDSHVWLLGGEAPAFLKSEEPFYLGGPVWRIELVSPVWRP